QRVRDVLLSYVEMANELMSLRMLDKHFGDDEAVMSADELVKLYRGLFAWFDRDGSGAVELEEFRAEMKEVLLAVASGLGFLLVQMVVEDGRSVAKHLGGRL
ncbi:Os10g0116300, partial [Oryza sativa Japonica Group]